MRYLLVLVLWVPTLCFAQGTVQDSARDIVKAAVNHFRGTSSRGEMSMTIHRPDWERTMAMSVLTAGDDRSLVRVLEPVRDAGNGTLSLDGNMWTYTPKINRIIKIPASMMNQNWMGSDFSNRDVSRSADIVDQYSHELLQTRQDGEHRIYQIKSVPLPEAAVVWGHEELTVRDDWVLLHHAFYDQDGNRVKALETTEIREFSGRPVASIMRMTRTDNEQEWTEMRTRNLAFDVPLSETQFTLSNLRNPRP